jgi:hypothetical protein
MFFYSVRRFAALLFIFYFCLKNHRIEEEECDGSEGSGFWEEEVVGHL